MTSQAAAREHLMPNLILTADLRLTDVPDEGADWREIEQFALSFNGYEHPRDFIREARRAFQAGTANLDALTLTQLRTCLFCEQRTQRWCCSTPGFKLEETYMRALVGAIRTKLVGQMLR